MKRIFSGLLYALIVTTAWGQSEPITTLQGDQGTKFGSPKLVTPNLQATKTAKGGRIETGNSNLLSNPSFEHTTVNTGWTCSLGTVSTATGTDGTQGLGIVSAGAGVRCYQLSTINVANLKGALGQARAMVKTTDTIMKVCGLVDGNGAANERNCVTVNPTSTDTVFYQAMTQPFQMGGTSNGIVIYTTTTTVQPTVIDEAHVGVVNGSLASFSNNTGRASYVPTLTALTYSASDCQYKRETTDLIMDCKFSYSASAAAEARVSLPIVNGVQLVTAGTTIIPALKIAGTWGNAVAEAFMGAILIEPSVAYVTIGKQGASTFALSKINGNSLGSSGTISFNARVPIAGWEANTNAAIAGCVSAFGCENTATATSSATGVISGDDLKMFSGNCVVTSTSTYTCPFVSGNYTVTPKCLITAVDNANVFRIIGSNTNTSQLQFQTFSTSAVLASPVNISCTKSAPDFKPKTVVVSPLQGYVKVPGAENLNVETFSVSYGATATTACTSGVCAYLDQIGNAVISITRGVLGGYTALYSKMYLKLKCSLVNGVTSAGGTMISNGNNSCTNCNTMTFNTFSSAFVAIDSYGTYSCQGTY